MFYRAHAGMKSVLPACAGGLAASPQHIAESLWLSGEWTFVF